MTGAVVAASAARAPTAFILDNFEVDDFATKWPSNQGNYTANFIRVTSPVVSGTASVGHRSSGNTDYASTRYLINPPAGRVLARGEILSFRISKVSTSNAADDGMAFHADYGIGTLNFGYFIFMDANLTLIMTNVVNGTGSQIASISAATMGYATDVRIRTWVLPNNHPTTPNKWFAEVRNPTTDALIASTSVVATNNTGTYVVMAGLETKGSGGTYSGYYDDIRIDGIAP